MMGAGPSGIFHYFFSPKPFLRQKQVRVIGIVLGTQSKMDTFEPGGSKPAVCLIQKDFMMIDQLEMNVVLPGADK